MTPSSDPKTELVPAGPNLLSSFPSQLPLILSRAGQAAVFATEEFFFGRIRNTHTRSAYLIAVKRFLAWAEGRGLSLSQIAPKDVGIYIDGMRAENTSVSTRKQHLAALRHYFDGLVTRHAILLNPALSVRGERYQVVEGKTPEITVQGARTLLKAIGTSNPVELHLRDHKARRVDLEFHSPISVDHLLVRMTLTWRSRRSAVVYGDSFGSLLAAWRSV